MRPDLIGCDRCQVDIDSDRVLVGRPGRCCAADQKERRRNRAPRDRSIRGSYPKSALQRSNHRLDLAVELGFVGESRGGDGFDEDADLAVFLVTAVDQVVGRLLVSDLFSAKKDLTPTILFRRR